MEGGQRAHGVRVLPEPIQQLRRLLDTALPDPQLGQADQGGPAALGHPPVEVPGGLDSSASASLQRPAAVRMPP